jgi:hypothetical protein
MNYLAPVPAEFTGETPLASFGLEFGGRDDWEHRDWAFSGNIDAPELIAAGSTSNRNWDQIPASTNTPRSAS